MHQIPMKFTKLYFLMSIVQAIQFEIDDGFKEQNDSSSQFVRNDDQNNRHNINNRNEGEELPITSEENIPVESEEYLSDTSVESSSFASEEDLSETSDENLQEKTEKNSTRTMKKISIKTPDDITREYVFAAPFEGLPHTTDSNIHLVREVPTNQRENIPVSFKSVEPVTLEGEASSVQNSSFVAVPKSLAFDNRTEVPSNSEDKRLHIDHLEKQIVTQKQKSPVISGAEIIVKPKEDLSLIQEKNEFIAFKTLAPSENLKPRPVFQKNYATPMKIADIASVNNSELRPVISNNSAQNIKSEAFANVKQTESRADMQEVCTPPVNKKAIAYVKRTESSPIEIKNNTPIIISEVKTYGRQSESPPVAQTTRSTPVNSKAITTVKQTESLPVVQTTCSPFVKPEIRAPVNRTESLPVVQKLYPPLNISETTSPENQAESRPVVQEESALNLQRNSTTITLSEVRPQRKTITIGIGCGRSKPVIFWK